MVGFTPLGLLLLPALFFAGLRFRWALTAFIISIPWKTAVLFNAVGHPFNLPEMAILVLSCHVGWQLLRGRSFLRLGPSSLALIGFGVAATLSVIVLLIDSPTNLYGRPYNIAAGYGKFTLVEISFSLNSVTQLALRWFFVGATVILGVIFAARERLVEWALTVTVANALLVGVVGIIYQLSIIAGVNAFPETLQSLGFARFPVSSGTLGPLPRMFSITGEPGETAHFLLFGLAITGVTALAETDGVFNQSTATVLSAILLVLLLLTTGATGYGGLIVFAVVLFVTALVVDSISLKSVTTVLTITTASGVFGLAALTVLTDVDMVQLVALQVEKLQFSAQSGSLRARYITHSLSLWAQRPVFGTGVGTQNGTSFLASVLAETGTLGGMALVAAIATAYRSGVATATTAADSRIIASAIAVATLGGTALIARSTVATLFPWLWLALALPGASLQDAVETPSTD